MNLLNQVSTQIVIVAAYGRRYSTKEQALAAWESGKDFLIVNGPYCSIRDIERMTDESSSVHIMFGNNEFVRVS